MEQLKVEDLSFRYPDGTAAVENISLAIKQGEFVVLCGASGSGKSTFLRLLKKGMEPRGKLIGSRQLMGTAFEQLTSAEAAARVGFVMQSPEGQIVTDKVWHELAFGLESIGLPQGEIRRRVGEMASYFGVEGLFQIDTAALSGGQKQLVNLASAAALHPELLILDEPTSQLDPISAQSFIEAVRRLNRDFGVTVLIAEHRLEEVLPIADRVLVMEQGRLLYDYTPSELCGRLSQVHPVFSALPAAARIYRAAGGKDASPLTVREGRVNELCCGYLKSLSRSADEVNAQAAPCVTVKELWVSYSKRSADILRSVDLVVSKGEIYALLGGNGSGKTTLLKALAGIIKPLGGKIRFAKGIKAAYLPQSPCELFTEETVRDELRSVGSDYMRIAEEFELTSLLEKHPYDLSGGEQQRLAIAKLTLKDPDLLLLDEPTKGMDAAGKLELVKLLKIISAKGTAVILVTHDTELAAKCAHRCGLLFDGEISGEAAPAEFFSQNFFYTTPVSRLARGIADGIVDI